MTGELDDVKRRLRATAKGQRQATAAALPEAGAAVGERLLASVPLPAGAAVSAYWPMGEELDPRPLMHALHGRGHPIGLPVVVGHGRPLLFRHWEPGHELEKAAFNTRVPTADRPELRPAVLLVPLLAFDRAGYRLGYGGGFYDRTLAALGPAGEVTAIGLAFADQEVAEVPRDAYDRRLDWIVTEREAVRID